MIYDYIVVGSGATGVTAAQTLTDDGASVLMLDGGQPHDTYDSIVPPGTFDSLRRSDAHQERYLLGEGFESLRTPTIATGAQLTAPRRFVVAEVDRYLKTRSDTFAPLESLALGGLGSAWGLGCSTFSESELHRVGLDPLEIRGAYQVVADRIGLSGEADDARPYTFADVTGVDPPVPLGPTADAVYRRYRATRASANRSGFYVGRPCLALITRPRDGRKPANVGDMEFYSDSDRSAWRPWIALDALRTKRFALETDQLVTSFRESDDAVVVNTLQMRSQARATFSAKRMILATGALGSARIVLRSSGDGSERLPLLCNPYTYLPSIVPSRLGRSTPERDFSLCQLALYHDPEGRGVDIGMGFAYAYRSLMLFRLLRETPLGLPLGIDLLQYLQSALLVVGVHHPDAPSSDKYVALEDDPSTPTGDRMFASYRLSDAEDHAVNDRERAYVRFLRTLRAFPFKRVRPGHGSSIHYAGTLPYCAVDRPQRLDPNGRLHGHRRVFVADGSGFNYLPAKGLTFTLMANAHRVAALALRS